MSKFQLILIGVFGVFLVGGILIFSVYKGGSQNRASVTVWGTIPTYLFSDIIEGTSLHQSKEVDIKYVEKSEDEFDSDFIEALASGAGPDVFILPSEKILRHRNKVFPIPYDIFSTRQFKDSFIEGAEVYMFPEGTLGIPIFVDPLVMYWNRILFTEAKITEPPKYWDELYNLVDVITQKDGALNISKSAVALGEFANISHAKEITLNLAMQSGNPIVIWSEGGKLFSVLTGAFNKTVVPAEAALNFYTEFSNPAKSSYSWNRSLANSTNYFLGGDLALYFGFASEILSLQQKNPNLNFDVAVVPVSREGGSDVSFASFNALAITKNSKNLNAAFAVISALSGKKGATAFSEVLRLPPARRDLLGSKPDDAYESVFYDSAIRVLSWLDPDPDETDLMFKEMIESITSGRARTIEAIAKAQRELSSLLPQE